MLSETSWMGGKNSFLGWTYVAVGLCCVVVAVLFGVKHCVRPRKLGHFAPQRTAPEQERRQGETGRVELRGGGRDGSGRRIAIQQKPRDCCPLRRAARAKVLHHLGSHLDRASLARCWFQDTLSWAVRCTGMQGQRSCACPTRAVRGHVHVDVQLTSFPRCWSRLRSSQQHRCIQGLLHSRTPCWSQSPLLLHQSELNELVGHVAQRAVDGNQVDAQLLHSVARVHTEAAGHRHRPAELSGIFDIGQALLPGRARSPAASSARGS